MADINQVWVAKITQCAAMKQQNSTFETYWTNQQFSKLSPRKQSRWSLNKIRKYLLDNFCEPKAVEIKIAENLQERYEDSMKTGISMKI